MNNDFRQTFEENEPKAASNEIPKENRGEIQRDS